MKINVKHTTYVGRTGKGAPGDPEWREEIDRKLSRLYDSVAGDLLEIAVGAQYSEGTAEHVRAMVVAYGSGSAAGNGSIHAGPLGRIVWNGGLTGKHPSRAKSTYDLPGAFNHTGNDFVNLAEEEVTPIFQQAVAEVWKHVPQQVWQDAVYLI